MKLREYLVLLVTLADEKQEALDYEVITSSDDEGNDYNPVVYEPSVGCYDKANKEYDTQGEHDNNSICLN